MAKKKAAVKKVSTAASATAESTDAGSATEKKTAKKSSPKKKSSGIKRALHSFKNTTIKRSKISFHPDNPRDIDPGAFAKLKRGIQKHGLMSSLQVNRRTQANGFPAGQDGAMVLIGGHQRLRAMDELKGRHKDLSVDYDVPIDVVEVPSAKEKEKLVLLNNPALQGNWLWESLGDVLVGIAAEGGSVEDAGYDKAELMNIFDEGEVASLLGEEFEAQVEADAPVLSEIDEMHQLGKEQLELEAKEGAGDTTGEVDVAGADTNAPDEEQVGEVNRFRNEREGYTEREDIAADNDDTFFVTLVAESTPQLVDFLARLRLPVNTQAVKLVELEAAIEREVQQAIHTAE